MSLSFFTAAQLSGEGERPHPSRDAYLHIFCWLQSGDTPLMSFILCKLGAFAPGPRIPLALIRYPCLIPCSYLKHTSAASYD